MNSIKKNLLNKNNHISFNNLNKNIIFREYKKKGDLFVALNNFYSIFIDEDNKLKYQELNSKNSMYEVDNNIFEYTGNRIYNDISSYIEKKYIHLCVIHDIEFTIEDININKQELFKRFIENDIKINQELLEDIYYNQDFSNKINMDLSKVNKIMDDKIEKTYLFKININELQCGTYIEHILT